jgi:DNA-binding IclR family transcriptional regulator
MKGSGISGKPVKDLQGGGIQTVGTVTDLFAGFIGSEPQPMLKSLAERTGMHPAKIHRYLVSFARMGYVRQDPATARYRLGPSAVRLGQAALAAVPVVGLARPVLRDLVERFDRTAFLALWTQAGPRVVLQQRETASLAIAAHVGSLFPILTSSTGRTFAAWLPPEDTASRLVAEFAALTAWPVPGCPRNPSEAAEHFAEIRARRMERATGQLGVGIHGLSAPVFDGRDRICAVISMLGHADSIDIGWDSPFAQGLTEAATAITSAMR